jgi:hypothetical protein
MGLSKMNKVTAASIALLLMASTSGMAQTVKFDSKVAKAAAKKVAEKIGETRKAFDYDEKPEMVAPKKLKNKSINTSYLPEPTSTPKKALRPITNNQHTPGIDYTTTSSINRIVPRHAPKVIWERFDRYGNPIEVK